MTDKKLMWEKTHISSSEETVILQSLTNIVQIFDKSHDDTHKDLCRRTLTLGLELLIGNLLGFPPYINVYLLRKELDAAIHRWEVGGAVNGEELTMTSLVHELDKVRLTAL